MIVTLATLTILSLIVFVSPAEASPPTTNKSPIHVPQDYSTITAAVTAAAPRQKIIVQGGPYNEHVVIDSSKTGITLIGDNATLDGAGCTLPAGFELIGADYVTIKNFTITHYSIAGIYIHEDWSIPDPAIGNTVKENHIVYNCGHGVYIASSHFNKVGPNQISYNAKHGIFIEDGDRNHIKTCNDIMGNGWSGIELHNAAYSVINHPTVVGNHWMGLYADSASHHNLINGSFSENWHSGIWVEGSYNTIQGNTATGHGYDGIHIRGGDYNFVCYNNASNNAHDGICVMFDPGTWDMAEWNCICYNTALNNWYDLVFAPLWQPIWFNNHWDFNTYNVAHVSYWPPQPWNPPLCPPGCPCPCC